jgi:coniferyl-aldehyde dehydrogenase
MNISDRSSAAVQPESSDAEIRAILDQQRARYLKDGPSSVAARIDRLDRTIAVLVDHEQEIVKALADDFGHRSHHQSRITDVFGAIEPLKFAKKNIRKWMKSERRSPQFPMGLLGARARVDYQPLGVIGVISPWNFPVNLTFAPLAGIFAAGNSVMIKPSEYTPATSALIAEMIREAFDVTEAAVILGGPAVGEAFTKQPFDHLLFTGATSVAKHVMRAASENLVPVTLELGGKSPVVIGKGADMDQTADRIMTGKMMNAGQICLAPDYVLVDDAQVSDFVESAAKSVKKMYPTLKDNPDYTSVVNQRHLDRLKDYVADARSKGADVVELNPANEDFSQQPAYKMPPSLILNPTDDMKVMQDEIFGPLLPVKTYQQVDAAVDYVNHRPRPLGLYYFGADSSERDMVLNRTTSGGVTVNDVVMHVSMEDLPFGGVGPSGMGSYHGYDGFKAFSHAKAVFTQAKFDLGAMLRPPYGERVEKMMSSQIKK